MKRKNVGGETILDVVLFVRIILAVISLVSAVHGLAYVLLAHLDIFPKSRGMLHAAGTLLVAVAGALLALAFFI